MKGYEEFKGYRSRIAYDPKTKTFTTRTVANTEFSSKADKKKHAARKRIAAKKRSQPVNVFLHAIAP